MKELNCKLHIKEKNGYKNLILVTENGTTLEIYPKFYAKKLTYKLVKEVENVNK